MAISQDNITVFPSVNKTVAGVKPKECYELSEKNIVGLINKILDNASSFAISEGIFVKDSPSDTEFHPFEFMIGGYYFSINTDGMDQLSEDFDSSTAIYACITLETTNGYSELKNGAVSFLSSPPTSAPGVYTIKIAERTNVESAWQVPRASILKYRGERLSGVIDGNLS